MRYALICIHLVLSLVSFDLMASAQEEYLNRFNQYEIWNQHLPNPPSREFLKWIKKSTPLANKLRDKWLLSLGQNKQWDLFNKYYKNSPSTSLNCYLGISKFYTNQPVRAMNIAKSLWLTGQSQPGACRELFDLLLKQPNFDERFINARIILALNQDNTSLVQFLLTLFKQPHTSDIQTFNNIIKQPTAITALPHDIFHGYFYLYGLKKIALQFPQKLNEYWKLAQKENRLTQAQQQQFLAFMALQQSMHNESEAEYWFSQVKPAYYTEELLEWQLRIALKNEDWRRVNQLCYYHTNKNDPTWMYWQARAMEALGQVNEAYALYRKTAQNRHYYGFLASKRIKQSPQFEAQAGYVNLTSLRIYQPFTERIRKLHQQQRDLEATNLLNDFISELPLNDKISIIHWISNVLQWYPRAVALSSTDEFKNYLILRFPLGYQSIIQKVANHYQVPEALLYAVIRQESAFNPAVSSKVGAQGLMQIMPSTAKLVASNNHIQYRQIKELLYPATNIMLGTAYLHFLSTRFDQHPILMAAAYNAGPSQVNYWLKHHPPKDPDLWVETLPWKETRNYLKNVIAFYAIYQYRLQKPIKIEQVLKPLSTKSNQ